jgi:DNA-binding transcriptional MerR regulator
MLRHYDELGLLKPERVERFSGYRYYTIEQLHRLNRILFFKDLGFSMQEVKDLLHEEPTLGKMQGRLRSKQLELERQLEDTRYRLEQIEAEGKPSP